MASPYNELVIMPVADESGVLAALGISTTPVPLYTADDPTPRTQSASWFNTSWTAVIDTAIETPVTGARTVFPNSTFIKWHKTNPNDPQWPKINPQDVLVSLGLTTSST